MKNFKNVFCLTLLYSFIRTSRTQSKIFIMTNTIPGIGEIGFVTVIIVAKLNERIKKKNWQIYRGFDYIQYYTLYNVYL
jgi:hypothetical protein